MAGVAGDGQRVAAVCACIRKHTHFIGSERAVLLHACFHPQFHRMTRPRGDKFFFTRVFVNHGPAGGDGQMGSYVFHQDFLFAAETAADARLDDAHPFHR